MAVNYERAQNQLNNFNIWNKFATELISMRVIPKSICPERIKENANVFDFNLNEEQMQILAGLDQGLRFCPDPLEIPGSYFI